MKINASHAMMFVLGSIADKHADEWRWMDPSTMRKDCWWTVRCVSQAMPTPAWNKQQCSSFPGSPKFSASKLGKVQFIIYKYLIIFIRHIQAYSIKLSEKIALFSYPWVHPSLQLTFISCQHHPDYPETHTTQHIPSHANTSHPIISTYPSTVHR